MTVHEFNVPLWWGSLAAAVGPSSLSEHVYQTAARQQPHQFLDVIHRQRSEDADSAVKVAMHLDEKWRMKGEPIEAVPAVATWLSDISGWPDPIRGGSENLGTWHRYPLEGGKIHLGSSLPKPRAKTLETRLAALRKELRGTLSAFHSGFTYHEEKGLYWEAPWPGAVIPAQDPLPPELR
jgi:hypothetical protein